MRTAPWPRLRHRGADTLLAAAFLALLQAEIWVFSIDEPRPLALRVAATVLALPVALPLALRRRAPLAALVVNAAAVLLLVALRWRTDFYQWTNLVAVYSVAAHGTRQAALVALPAALLGVVAYFVAFPDEGGPVDAGFVLVMWVLAWLAGRLAAGRQAELELRDERDRSRALAEGHRARLDVELQRAGMARELHDVVGHTVNVMVVHAGAGRRALDDDPEGARRALETIEATGRAALAELDRVLGLLRPDHATAERAPQPTLADLTALAERFAPAGLTVAVTVDGALERVPRGLDLTAYRVAQEALTNTLKHAGARHADVHVVIGDDAVEVLVTDDGHGVDGATGPGRGLRGIRERARIHGGTASAGVRPEGGWAVRCRLPLPGR